MCITLVLKNISIKEILLPQICISNYNFWYIELNNNRILFNFKALIFNLKQCKLTNICFSLAIFIGRLSKWYMPNKKLFYKKIEENIFFVKERIYFLLKL